MATKQEKRVQSKNEKKGIDWFEATVNGGTLILEAVSAAAELAPIPYLQQAAGATLAIVSMVEDVKGNKQAFRSLAENIADIVCAMWKSYERSKHKDKWGSQLEAVIHDLLQTLISIQEFVEVQLARNIFVRILYSSDDKGKIKDYRRRLQQAVNKFEVSADLETHEVLGEIKTILTNIRDSHPESPERGIVEKSVHLGKEKRETLEARDKAEGRPKELDDKENEVKEKISLRKVSKSRTSEDSADLEQQSDGDGSDSPQPRHRPKRNAKKNGASPTSIHDIPSSNLGTNMDPGVSPGGFPDTYDPFPQPPPNGYGGPYSPPPQSPPYPYHNGYPPGVFVGQGNLSITNSNSGNISNTTISNVGNDNSIRISGAAKARRRRS